VDYAHGNQYQQPEIQALKEALEKRGGSIEMLTDTSLLKEKLKYASAYIIISPSVAFTTDETRVAQAFVERGGRLIVFTDATRGVVYSDYFTGSVINYPDANAVNPLLDYLYNVKRNDGNFRNVFFEKFGKHELTFGLKQVTLYGTHSLKASSGTLLFRSGEATLSSINDAHDPDEGGAVLSANGNVLAFGDFTFLTSPYQNMADNSTLITNIADFSLNGKQTVTLENFPYIFKQPILHVYPSAEVQLTSEMITAVAGLQTSLAHINTTVELVDEVPREGDTLILGTFASNDELQKLVKPFGITLDEESEFITVPKIGKVGRYGNGILLFERDKGGSRLIALADTSDDLKALMETISSGALDGCVLQNNIGVCGVGFGGSYSDESEATPESTGEPTAPEGEATPAPTPSG
jgi:hypothetical protein